MYKIHETFVKRELIYISENIYENSNNDDLEKNSENIIEDAEQSLYQLAERGSFTQSYMKFNQALGGGSFAPPSVRSHNLYRYIPRPVGPAITR